LASGHHLGHHFLHHLAALGRHILDLGLHLLHGLVHFRGHFLEILFGHLHVGFALQIHGPEYLLIAAIDHVGIRVLPHVHPDPVLVQADGRGGGGFLPAQFLHALGQGDPGMGREGQGQEGCGGEME
jgi:hypothetical protein